MGEAPPARAPGGLPSAPPVLLAAGRGAVAALATLAGAIAIAAAGLALLVPGTSPGTAARIGIRYALAFHGVSFEAPELVGRLSVGLFLGALPALAWLYRSAARESPERDAGPAALTVPGILTAAAYGAVFALAAALPLPGPHDALGPEVRALAGAGPVLWQASLLPGAFAALAIAIGAVRPGRAPSGPPPPAARGPARAALVGGSWMLAGVVVLSWVGVLVLAAVRPDGAAAYVRAVSGGGPARTAVVLGHHALLLPTQAVWTAVPAMGGCVVFEGAGRRIELLCLDRLPAGDDPDVLAAGPRRTSPAYLLFLLVPAGAVLAGGWAAGRAAAGGWARRMAAGASSGLVFALGFGAAAALARISIQGLSVGPEVVPSTVLALAWGVPGGAVGAWAGRVLEARRGV